MFGGQVKWWICTCWISQDVYIYIYKLKKHGWLTKEILIRLQTNKVRYGKWFIMGISWESETIQPIKLSRSTPPKKEVIWVPDMYIHIPDFRLVRVEWFIVFCWRFLRRPEDITRDIAAGSGGPSISEMVWERCSFELETRGYVDNVQKKYRVYSARDISVNILGFQDHDFGFIKFILEGKENCFRMPLHNIISWLVNLPTPPNVPPPRNNRP